MDHEIARIVQYVLIQFFYDMYTEKYLCYLNSSAQDSGVEPSVSYIKGFLQRSSMQRRSAQQGYFALPASDTRITRLAI